MKPFVYPEMMVHVGMCTHKNPEKILIISDDDTLLQDELSRYAYVEGTTILATRALESIRELSDSSYDLIVCEADGDAALLAHLSRVGKADGLVVMTHPNLDEVEANRQLMQVLGNYYKIIMPYTLGERTLLLSSKEYHPTADVILQRSDLLEGVQYYNCDIHTAAFAMPNYIRKTYLGVIRN